MFVVVTSGHDPDAAALLAHWGKDCARALSPRDLSRPGWRHHVGCAGEEWAVVAGDRVPSRDIRGVVSRLPAVREQDLPHIAAEDREYVAAEMNALLLSWLSRLRCPVLNRPTPTSLMGRNLSRERWLLLAARAGLTLARSGPLATDAQRARATAALTVVGDRWVGTLSPVLGNQAVRLAALAGMQLCTVRFDGAGPGAAFVDAELFTDLADPRVADALHAHMTRRGSE
jgi:hypothetical protein